MTRIPPRDNEVVINNEKDQKVFGPNTVIQVNLKTLIVVLGILLSGLTTAWLNINSKIEKSNEIMNNHIEKVSLKLETIRDQDLKQLDASVNQLKGNIDIILQENQRQFIQSNGLNNLINPQQMNNIKPQSPR